MSIDLTTSLLNIPNSFLQLSPTEKHVLTVLCYIAKKDATVYREIDRLSEDCNLSKKTIERTLKKLRDNLYLAYTGKYKGKFNKIPIYRIDFVHGLSGGELKSITDSVSKVTDSLSLDDGLSVHTNRQYKDNINDNNYMKTSVSSCSNSFLDYKRKDDSRSDDEFLKQCQYHINNRDKDKYTEAQAIKGLLQILKKGVFDTPVGYKQIIEETKEEKFKRWEMERIKNLPESLR